jgi:hypothetical protein
MYKVTFYASNSTSEQSVLFKWFKTANEAFDYSRQLGDRVIETKHYNDLESFPLPDLDMS